MPQPIKTFFKFNDFTGDVQIQDHGTICDFPFLTVHKQPSKYKRNFLEKIGIILIRPAAILNQKYNKTDSKLFKITLIVCAVSVSVFVLVGVCFKKVGESINKKHPLIKQAIVQIKLLEEINQKMGRKAYFYNDLDETLRWTIFDIFSNSSSILSTIGFSALDLQRQANNLDHDFMSEIIIKRNGVKKRDLLLFAPNKLDLSQELEKKLAKLALEISPNRVEEGNAILARLRKVEPIITAWKKAWFTINDKIKKNDFNWDAEEQQLVELIKAEPKLEENLKKYLADLKVAKKETEPAQKATIDETKKTLSDVHEIAKKYIQIIDQLNA